MAMLTRRQERARNELREELRRAGTARAADAAQAALVRGAREHWNWVSVDPYDVALDVGVPRAAAVFVRAGVVDMGCGGRWGGGAAVRAAVAHMLPDISREYTQLWRASAPYDGDGYAALLATVVEATAPADLDARPGGAGGATALGLAVRRAAAYVAMFPGGQRLHVQLRALRATEILVGAGARVRGAVWGGDLAVPAAAWGTAAGIAEKTVAMVRHAEAEEEEKEERGARA